MCLQHGCRPAALTVSSLKDNFPNVSFLTDDPSLWYHLRSSLATVGTSASMKACSLWNDIAFGVPTPYMTLSGVTDVSFFNKHALDSCAHEDWSYSSEDRRWNKGLNWTCQQLIPLHLFKKIKKSLFSLKETSLWGYVILEDIKAPRVAKLELRTCFKGIKEGEWAMISMLLLLSYSRCMHQTTGNWLKCH